MIEQLNGLAQAWWDWMGPMFWQMGVLVLLVGTIDFLLRRHLWPQLRYALWLLILVKLITPPTFSLSTGVVSQLRVVVDQRTAQSASAGPLSHRPGLAANEHATDVEIVPPLAVESPAVGGLSERAASSDITESRDHAKLSWKVYSMTVWLIGVGTLGGWLVVRLRRLRHMYSGKSRRADLPAWLGPLLTEAAQKLRLRRLPEIVLSRDIPSPAVFGAFRPVLVLPEAATARLSRKCTEHILLHELAHIKRGDLLVNSLYTLLQIVYWFNPLLWLLRRRLQHLRELCCDATVARILRERTAEYRETILESARRLLAKPVAPGIGLLGLFENSSRLRVRLQWLEKKTWKYRGLRIATVLALSAGMCVFVLPMAKARRSAARPDIQGNWPCFRGPGGAGVSAHTNIPKHWDGPSGAGILWKSPIPLAGNNSPIVWEDRVFISGGKGDELEVYCFDGSSGKRLWTGSVPMTRPAGNRDLEVMEDTGLAAPTMVTDGKRVCAIFASGDVGCFDFHGQRLWTRGLGIPDSTYGYASSLAIYRNLAIVQYDQAGPEDGKSELLALDTASGNIVWRTKRPVGNSWSSPIVTGIEGRDVLVTCADPWVIAYDPAAGTELWRSECLAGDIASSPIYANGRVFVIEPYSKLVALDPRGRGDVTKTHLAWSNEDGGPDICSPVSNGEMIFLLTTDGVLSCHRTSDGTKLWEEEVEKDLREFFFGSPSLVDGSLYLLGEKGTMFMLQADAEFKLLDKSTLGERCHASPAFTQGRIYIRGEKNLFCIGSREDKPQKLVGSDKPAEITRHSAPIVGHVARFDGAAADLPGVWPGFRGGDFDNVSKDDVPLARQWPAQGPKVIWSQEVGEGYAGAAIRAGRVYLMDYDRENQADAIRCFSLADGKEIWRHSYPVKIKRYHGMTRTVPAVTDKHVVTIGPKCHVTCVDAGTGEFGWMLDLVRDYNTKVPQWYTAQCPLIDNGKAIIAPAGDDVLMMAVDCASGEILWTTPNPDKWVMTHSSIVPMTFAGERFYIYCGGSTSSGGVVGVSARDGRVLWKNEQWRVRTNVPAPVVVGPDRIFVSAGYGQTKYGCAMLRLIQNRGRIHADLEFLHPAEVFGSMQQTPIFYQEHLYGVGMDKQLLCLDLNGQIVWTSTSANKFGFGPYMIAHDRLYVMDDAGVLTMVEASPTGYSPLAKAQLFADGVETWGPMAMASGRLILRDLTRMICVDATQASKAKEVNSISHIRPGNKLQTKDIATQPPGILSQ